MGLGSCVPTANAILRGLSWRHVWDDLVREFGDAIQTPGKRKHRSASRVIIEKGLLDLSDVEELTHTGGREHVA